MSILSEKIQKLIDAGLLREEFIHKAKRSDMRMPIEIFADFFYAAYKGHPTIGALMIKHGVLTSQFIENIIFTGNTEVITLCATSLGSKATPGVKRLIKNGFIGTAVALRLLKSRRKPLLQNEVVRRLTSILTPGKSNALNFGITNIIEYEAAFASALGMGQERRCEFIAEQHLLLRAMRTTEAVEEKRKQVEVVVSANDDRPLLVQLEAVWQHYAIRSRLFKMIEAEKPVPQPVLVENVATVNAWQAEMSGKHILESDRRFIDIYGRYNCAEMDPFMLAIIARTAGWYVDSQRASLFTNVRLVPDRPKNTPLGLDRIAWAALAFYPKMGLLEVKEREFVESMLGANRIFLSHSRAHEATDRHSIPIIGLATWKNPAKFLRVQPYALFSADFDQGDQLRYVRREWHDKDQYASISGTIEETLRALREAETLEIARAHRKPLRLGAGYRWNLCQ